MHDSQKEAVRAFKKHIKSVIKDERKISEDAKKQFASDSVVNSGKELSSHLN